MSPQKTNVVTELLMRLVTFVAFLQCYGAEFTQIRIPISSEVELESCLQMKQRLQSVNSTDSIVCQNVTSETSTVFDSIKEVLRDNADVAMTSGDEMITVYRLGLKPIISSKSKQRIVLLVKQLMVPTLDLTQKRGCFGQALDAGVLGLASVLPSKMNLCHYDLRIARTVMDACMPGAKNSSIDFLLPNDRELMCKLCVQSPDSSTAVNCNADRHNYYYGPNGTQRCLEDERSDFAVVHLDDVKSLPNGIVVMCRNGTTVDSLQSVDDACPLITIPSKQFVANSELTDNQLKEIRDILLQALDPKEFYGVFVSPEPTLEEEIIFINIDRCEQRLESEPTGGVIVKIAVIVGAIIGVAIGATIGVLIAIRFSNQHGEEQARHSLPLVHKTESKMHQLMVDLFPQLPKIDERRNHPAQYNCESVATPLLAPSEQTSSAPTDTLDRLQEARTPSTPPVVSSDTTGFIG